MSATLTIRGVAPETRDRLRARAARNGRSMAAEARAILDAARDDGPPETPDLAEAIRRRFAPFGGREPICGRRRSIARKYYSAVWPSCMAGGTATGWSARPSGCSRTTFETASCHSTGPHRAISRP